MKRTLIYTVHKAASMFLHRLGTGLERQLQLDFYSINNKKYHDQIKHSSWKSFVETTKGPCCFGPIRAGEDIALPVFPDHLENYSVVLHLRDPRDVLTSTYYSHAYSHPATDKFRPSTEQRTKWEEHGVDRFVINRIERVKKEYEELCARLLDNDKVVLVKYEDMVTDFGKWLKAFLSAFSEFEPRQKGIISPLVGKNTHKKIYAALYKKYKADFKPAKKQEDIYAHNGK